MRREREADPCLRVNKPAVNNNNNNNNRPAVNNKLFSGLDFFLNFHSGYEKTPQKQDWTV